MKTGILTFHDGINYGAFFQVYSMQTYLLAQGFEPYVINYKNAGFTERERRCFVLPNDPEGTERNKKKMALFGEAHKNLRLTRRMFEPKDLSSLCFDRIVIGSDEVWNFGTELIGFDPAYFSKGLVADRIISYAASFGSIQAGSEIPEEVRENLSRLKAISVRDDNSALIAEEIIGRPVPVVLDPTFLTDFSSQAVLPGEEGYILVYGFFSQSMIDRIREYARKKGRKTISIGYHRPWCDESRDMISPFEWLGYFKNCACAITTMFHGMIYSILNRKNFCMYLTDYRINKIGSLVDDLGLAARVIGEDGDLATALEGQVDFDEAFRVLGEKRRLSESYLLQSLNS